jgi:hypothetical protein
LGPRGAPASASGAHSLSQPSSDAAVDAATALCAGGHASRWSGPDPYDALAARWPRPLVGGKRRRQALIQLHARAPVDLRPLSRRSDRRIAKALALFAMADMRLARLGVPGADSRAEESLELLAADTSAGAAAWGYPWDVQTRWSFYEKDSPNVVVTAFAIEALADGERTERAEAAARWVQDELYVQDIGAYGYHPGDRTVIHNASLLGARAAWKIRDADSRVRPAVERALELTLAAQRSDGSFPYGDGPGLEWVDSFHTAYVLECLTDLGDADAAIRPAVERGYGYWRERFFDERGRALLYPERAFPEDAHSAGSALTALARLHAAGIAGSDLVERVAERVATAMVKGSHAVHRRYRFGPTRVRYVRWADGHVALGLANAALALRA